MTEYSLNQPQPSSAAQPAPGRITDRRGALILLLGDVVTLALFVFIGQSDHDLIDAANPLEGIVKAVLPFLIVWIAAAFAVGAYRTGAADLGWRTALGRWLIAWLIAAPLGVLVRALWLDRAVIPTAFLWAALIFGGLMLLTWRVLFILAWHKLRGRA